MVGGGPTGTLTFLFTDVEESTPLVARLGQDYADLLEVHRQLLRTAIERHGGYYVGAQRDGCLVAFERVTDAVAAAVDAQLALTSHTWPPGAEFRVRMGLHTGEADLVAGSYVGLTVHQASRVCAAAHGGQIALSKLTRDLAGRSLPAAARLRSLGVFLLKGIDEPQELFQLEHPNLRSEFPPLRTGPAAKDVPVPLASFREAAQRREWETASELFMRLDRSALEPADFDMAADAAWWCCRLDESIAARQEAYARYIAADDDRRAGYAAWQLARDHGIKGRSSAVSGWLKRAERHLAAHSDCVERGFLAVTQSEIALTEGDLDAARASAELAVDLGRRCSSLDLHAMGIQTLGRVLIEAGDSRKGMALLDEAMTLVVAQRLDPLFTGVIYCNVVATCMRQADLGRASEWTDAAMTWCGSVSDLTPFHGICRLHRVEILAYHGDWDEATSEALQTAQEMQGMEQHVIAEAMYALGDINLRRGDLAGAEDWFMRAHKLGRDPQPGLAGVRLAEGNVEAATAGLRLSLASTPETGVQRARLLSAQVEAALVEQSLGVAREAVEALQALVADMPSLLLESMALIARASLHLAEDDLGRTLEVARHAWSIAQQLKLTYLIAKARALIGVASKRAGDLDLARAELEAAREMFERLGAMLDARSIAKELTAATDLPRGLSGRELEVLRFVAAGKTNREIATAMVISEHTVSRHLQNIFRKLEVSSRAAATAFAFENSLV